MVALLTSVRNSPCFGGLRRTKTCHRQLFARPSMLFGSFCTTQKARKTFLSQEAPRFCKPRISPPQLQLRTATIKTFSRKLRGFANLESAHKNNNLVQSNEILLPPSAAFFLLFDAKSRAKTPFPFRKTIEVLQTSMAARRSRGELPLRET